MDMYVLSVDTQEHQLELYNALEEKVGVSLPFVSDPELDLIDHLGMKNEDVAYRGYAIMDKDGKVVLNEVNDHWGEELDKTLADIQEAYDKLK